MNNRTKAIIGGSVLVCILAFLTIIFSAYQNREEIIQLEQDIVSSDTNTPPVGKSPAPNHGDPVPCQLADYNVGDKSIMLTWEADTGKYETVKVSPVVTTRTVEGACAYMVARGKHRGMIVTNTVIDPLFVDGNARRMSDGGLAYRSHGLNVSCKTIFGECATLPRSAGMRQKMAMNAGN